MNEQVLAEIYLKGCPIGNVLDKTDPDNSVEDEYFPGWVNGLTAPPNWRMLSFLRVIKDQGREVLEHTNKSDRSLVTGSELWGDYSVESQVRQLNSYTMPSNDDPHAILALSGVIFRYQDLRRHYFFGMEGYDRFVLYRKEDESKAKLGEWQNGIDRSKYYHLKVQLDGERIACFVDGEQVLVAYDNKFLNGKAGVRTNTRSRLFDVRICATPEAQMAYTSRMVAHERDVTEASGRYPRPVLWKRIDIENYWPCAVRFGDFRGAGKKEIVLEKSTDGGPRVVCLDLEGEVQFDQTYPKAAGLQRSVVHDLDGDGVEDFIGLEDGRIRLVSGKSGDVTAETELPQTGPFIGHRNVSMENYLHSLRVLWPCRIRKTEKAQDLILRDGDGAGTGYSIWAFDEKLDLRWRQDAHTAWYGMYIWFHDADGDGRDEILPGYDLYDGDGNHLWTMEGAEYIEDSGGAGHIDHAAFGELDGDESNGPEIGIAGSDPGFFLVDATDGTVLCNHRYGHVQGIYAGNFRTDQPGLEMWMGDRWGTYGILNLVGSTGDPLARMEPDNRSQGGPAVNWHGDGEELLFISTSPEAFGLYDARCRKVVIPICEGLPITWGGGMVEDVVGDPRDEIIYVHEGAIYIVTQDGPYRGDRIYAPTRRMDISEPGWQETG